MPVQPFWLAWGPPGDIHWVVGAGQGGQDGSCVAGMIILIVQLLVSDTLPWLPLIDYHLDLYYRLVIQSDFSTQSLILVRLR